MLGHLFHRSPCALPCATTKGLVAGAVPARWCPGAAGGGHGATKTQAPSTSRTWRMNLPEGGQKEDLRTRGTAGGHRCGLLGLSGADGASWLSRILFFPQDAWSDAQGQLHMDSQQDYQLLGARRAPEGLYLLFRRAFSTCDPKDYLIEVRLRPHPATTLPSPIPALGDQAGLQTPTCVVVPHRCFVLGTASGVCAV